MNADFYEGREGENEWEGEGEGHGVYYITPLMTEHMLSV